MIKSNISHLLSLLCCIGVLGLLYNKDDDKSIISSLWSINSSKLFNDIDLKLNVILDGTTVEKSMFHMNANLINYLFIIKEYKDYNPRTWNNIINGINSILTLLNDVSLDVDSTYPSLDYYNTFTVSRDMYINVINNLHSMIFKIPLDSHDSFEKKHFIIFNKIRNTLKISLNTIKLYCNKNIVDNGINIHTKFIKSDSVPTGIDSKMTDTFNLYL